MINIKLFILQKNSYLHNILFSLLKYFICFLKDTSSNVNMH
jgi:hypothetical protein